MWVEGGGWWWPDGLERERRPLADTGLVLISPWQSGPRLQAGSSQAPVRPYERDGEDHNFTVNYICTTGQP